MKRLAIFMHWDKDNIIDQYVLNYISALRPYCQTILFVSNSQINENEKKKIEVYSPLIYIRDNIGYDFKAWGDGIQFLGYEKLTDYDEVIICNDSCYAPLFPFNELFEKVSGISSDLIGITDSYEIKYHLQSYFLIFKKELVKSEAFQTFWKNIGIKENKYQIISDYEIGLTQQVINAGFQVSAVFPSSRTRQYLSTLLNIPKIALSYFKNRFITQNRDHIHVKNIEHFTKREKKITGLLSIRGASPVIIYWEKLVKKRCPFIKIQLLRENPQNNDKIKNWELYLNKLTDYDLELIKKHLNRC